MILIRGLRRFSRGNAWRDLVSRIIL